MNKKKEIDGNQLAEALYGDQPKKRKRKKKIEKVSKPEHWQKDFDPHELKQQQSHQSND